MARPRKPPSSRGKGKCGFLGCKEPRAPEHFLCKEHTLEIQDIMTRGESFDAYSAFMGVSGKKEQKSKSRTPRCCAIGCDNERIPPHAYCDDHMDLEGAFVD